MDAYEMAKAAGAFGVADELERCKAEVARLRQLACQPCQHIEAREQAEAEVERLKGLFISTCESRDAWIKQCDSIIARAVAQMTMARERVAVLEDQVERLREQFSAVESETGCTHYGAWEEGKACRECFDALKAEVERLRAALAAMEEKP